MTDQPLLGRRVNVLDKGWIELQDMMGDDLAIVNAARVSYLGDSKGDVADKKLLFYLMEHHHTTPFEMVEFKFRCRAPLVTWWQWARHRTWSYNAQCLDGDTEIIFNKPDQLEKGILKVGSKIPLWRLYRNWQDPAQRARLQHMNLRTLNEEDMSLGSAHIHEVHHAGKKPGFKITTEDGKSIIASSEHRFLFEDGWKSLEDATGLSLKNGRATWKELPEIYINGKPLETAYLYTDKDWLYYQYHTMERSQKEIATIVGCSPATIRKYIRLHNLADPERSKQARFSTGQTPWNKGLHYSFDFTDEERARWSEIQRKRWETTPPEERPGWKGGMSTDRQKIGAWTTTISSEIFRRDNYTCAICGETTRTDDPFHAHHIIPIWADQELQHAYDPENLITLHKSCHQFLHGNDLELEFAHAFNNDIEFKMELKENYRQTANSQQPHSHATPRLKKIVSIEYVGEVDMYDLTVEGPYPNYIANWFVVHNSGRYTAFEEKDFYIPSEWRLQARNNKQASEGALSVPEADALTEKLLAHYEQGFALYQEALDAGVAREMARLFLPGFAVYYTWVVKVDAHNLMHFLRLRMAPDAQYEIRAYAWAIYEHFFTPALPWTAEAFAKYIMPTLGPLDES
jgi:thymidylate synthase (FAD)